MVANAIHVTMNGADSGQEIRSLYAWLQDDDHVRRYARVSLKARPPRPGEMGLDFETIELLVSSGFELANLALAYLSWRSSRIDKPTVTIRRGDIEVVLTKGSEESITTIIKALDSGE